MKREDLKRICHDFYKDLYKHKEILEETHMVVMEGSPATFTNAMNDSITNDITEKRAMWCGHLDDKGMMGY